MLHSISSSEPFNTEITAFPLATDELFFVMFNFVTLLVALELYLIATLHVVIVPIEPAIVELPVNSTPCLLPLIVAP